MDDKMLFIVAACTAFVGLILLWITAPPQEDGYRLQGTVMSVRGNTAVIAANVTLVTRGISVGDKVNLSVFWAEDRFIAPKQQE